MWWRSAALIASLFAGLIALALAGCGFQPLYGGTTAGGARLAEVMKGVDITPIPGRVGQKLRNELIFASTGGGVAGPTRYRLNITIKESVTDQLVQITGDATGQVYQLDATFKLIDSATGSRTAPPAPCPRASGSKSRRISATPPKLSPPPSAPFAAASRPHGRLQIVSRRELRQGAEARVPCRARLRT
jgi:LPS-assembly lipoprotein